MRAAILLGLLACSAPARPVAPPPTPVSPVAAAPVPEAAPIVVAEAPPPPPPPPPIAPTRQATLELAFAGDIIFGGLFNDKWKGFLDGYDPLVDIAPKLKADLTVANLETTMTKAIPKLTGDLRFTALPSEVGMVAKYFQAVSIANNHAADLDGVGLRETPGLVAATGLRVFGAAREKLEVVVETVDVKGWKVGFIAATQRLNRGHRRGDPYVPFFESSRELLAAVVPAVQQARKGHDIVVVMLHWGVEYTPVPQSDQVASAHAMIDAGADAIIGTHPHVLQRIERYGKGVIAYSLGNFVFPNSRTEPRKTGVLHLMFKPGCLDKVAFDPAVVVTAPGKTYYEHHPIPAGPRDFDVIAKGLQKLSRPTTLTVENGRLTAPGACP